MNFNAPEIIIDAIYEVNFDASHCGTVAVTRVEGDYFFLKKVSGYVLMMLHNREHDDYRIQFNSYFHKRMVMLKLPTLTEIDISFSLDSLIGE